MLLFNFNNFSYNFYYVLTKNKYCQQTTWATSLDGSGILTVFSALLWRQNTFWSVGRTNLLVQSFAKSPFSLPFWQEIFPKSTRPKNQKRFSYNVWKLFLLIFKEDHRNVLVILVIKVAFQLTNISFYKKQH